MEAEHTPIKLMTKQEAQEKDAQIIKLSSDYIDIVGPIALEIRDREGWRALGFKNWTDYCKHVGKRISAVNVMRLAQKAEVEQNVQARLPMRHALVLTKIDSPEGQREVFEEVKKAYPRPVELNYQTYVDKWFRENQPEAKRGHRSHQEGWTRGDLEDDSELAAALGKIENVYGHEDRKAIQDGTIGLTRKDIIALSALHTDKMKEIHYLIVANHWDVTTAIRFVSKKPHPDTTIVELTHYCLSTSELHYNCSVGGFDISIKACPAVASKIREPRRQASVKPRVTWITSW
jgi:hypothetical protein